MRTVKWTDGDGFVRRAIGRASDTDSWIRENGTPLGPPEISASDWEAIRRDLHNELMARELYSWHDVQASQSGLTAAVKNVVHRRILARYREVLE